MKSKLITDLALVRIQLNGCVKNESINERFSFTNINKIFFVLLYNLKYVHIDTFYCHFQCL